MTPLTDEKNQLRNNDVPTNVYIQELLQIMNRKSRPILFGTTTLIAAVLFAWTVHHAFGTYSSYRSEASPVREMAMTQLGVEAIELLLCAVVIVFSVRQLVGVRPTRSESKLSRRLRERDLDMGRF